MKRQTIVCLSSQGWDDGMWTNKQHIMSRLAKDHRVIYVEYGLRPLPMYLYQRYRKQPTDLFRPIRTLTKGSVERKAGLELFDWYTPILAGLFPYGHPIRDFSLFDIKAAMVAQHLEAQEIDDAIVWVYHPGYGDAVDRIPRRLLVYDCVDDYPSFPAYRDNPEWLAEREERLCRTADLVTCTAPALRDQKKPFNPRNTYLVHNVGDAEHFARARQPDTEVPPELARLDGPVFGFVGAVSDYKLNTDWLVALARARPDAHVVVIGPIGKADSSTDVANLEAQPNVHLLGHRPYEELPRYLKRFDVAMIPYRINQHTESVFPIKFFEFLATGTPVVISALPALEQYWHEVEVAEDAQEFIEACARALDDDDSRRRARRIEFADQNSWPARIGRILELIEERL